MQLYAEVGHLNQYPTLKAKLGSKFDAFAASPLLKIDAGELGAPFSNYSSIVAATVERPALIHVCAYEPNGFDHFYPDLLPPAPQFGTTQDLAEAVQALRRLGHLSMPCVLDSGGTSLSA